VVQRLRQGLPLLLGCLGLLACAGPGSNVYSRQQSQSAWQVTEGRVEAVHDAWIEGRRTYVGRVGGGAIGYEVGHSIGQGTGSDIAGAVGAVAGAVAGEAAEEAATRRQAWELLVALDDGRTLAIIQPADQAFSPGERVRVYSRHDGSARVAKL
jgi:outer membrane lipoprotein SlyB